MATLTPRPLLSFYDILLILQTCIILITLYRAGICLYNIFLHPLNRYPGPKLFAVSHIPMLYHSSKGDTHTLMITLHNKYGPIVRVGPNELSFISSSAWKDIYSYRGANGETFQKDPKMFGPDLKESEKGIFRADDASHERQRRIFSHAFSNKALKEQEPLVRGHVDTLIQRLFEHANSQSNRPINIVRMYNFITFDIMADLTFGEPLGMLKNGEYVPWVADVSNYPRAIVISWVFLTYPILNYTKKWLMPKSLIEKRKSHTEYAIQRVDRRLEKDLDRGDIWSLAMRHASLNHLTKWEMYSTGKSFMTAGTETVSTLLSGVTYFLLKNPEKLRKLTEEIRSVRLEKDLTITMLQGLKYLNACLEEALRCYPPSPNALHRITPRGGATICDNFVPEGTKVGVPNYAALHSGLHFRDPTEYVPERWLSEAPVRYRQDDKAAFQPFSVGPRNCIGQNLAMHEARLTIACVLWHFDLELSDPHFDWLHQGSYIVWAKHPLPVLLKPVDRNGS